MRGTDEDMYIQTEMEKNKKDRRAIEDELRMDKEKTAMRIKSELSPCVIGKLAEFCRVRRIKKPLKVRFREFICKLRTVIGIGR